MARRGAGEGSIYQRGDGRWVGYVHLGMVAGVRKRRVVYGLTRREVSEKLKELLSQQQRGQLGPASRVTVAEFVNYWSAEVVPLRLAPSSVYTRQRHVINHLVPRLGPLRLSRLSNEDIQRMINDLMRAGHNAGGIAAIRQTLSSALTHAVRMGLIQQSPMVHVVSPPRTRTPIEPWTPEQAARFLEVAATHRLHALWAVALALGLRRGEALGLRLIDVDLEERVLRIRQSASKAGGPVFIGPLKTPSSRRTLAIPATLLPILRQHLVRREQERLAAGPRWTESGLLFTTPDGRPLPPTTVGNHFAILLLQAGLPHVRIHDLRHYCASMLLAQGVSARSIMDILGHARISTTMDVYAHIMPELRQHTADVIDRILGSAMSPETDQKP